MYNNPYEILGVSKNASLEEISWTSNAIPSWY